MTYLWSSANRFVFCLIKFSCGLLSGLAESPTSNNGRYHPAPAALSLCNIAPTFAFIDKVEPRKKAKLRPVTNTTTTTTLTEVRDLVTELMT